MLNFILNITRYSDMKNVKLITDEQTRFFKEYLISLDKLGGYLSLKEKKALRKKRLIMRETQPHKYKALYGNQTILI